MSLDKPHRSLQAMELASRRAILVRCGDRSTSGVLLEAEAEAGFGRRGAFVLAPGLLLLGTELAKSVDTKDMARRAPRMSVIMRRGKPTGVGAIAPTGVSADLAVQRYDRTEPAADELAEAPAQVVAAWRWAELASALPQLLAELTLSRDEAKAQAVQTASDDDDAVREVRSLLSVFLVLRLQPIPSQAPSLRAVLRRVLPEVPVVPARGRGVCTACAPLNAPGLLGAVSEGVVSGTTSLLTLTDARVTPGSEGAGVYSLTGTPGGLPFAVVLSPLTWWRGETVGFTLCLSLRRLLRSLVVDGELGVEDPLKFAEELDVYGVDRSVVLVRSGCSWGTGVVVGRRVVLTCAHVVQNNEDAVVCWARQKAQARVVWRAPEGSPFDLAVLKLHDGVHVGHLVPLVLDTTPPRMGEPVLAAGFPLFSERSCVSRDHDGGHGHGNGRDLRPVLTRGNVGGWWSSAPSQVLTTCCIQSGNSGGPLLRVHPGGRPPTVIGILVCTATTGTGADSVVYPNVNFALWADAFQQTVDEYLESGDGLVFNKIHSKINGSVRKQWKLYPPAISKL